MSRRQRGRAGNAEPAGRLPGDADAQEQFILEALHDLRDTDVREVMTPRVDVVALSIPVTADDVTRAVRESGHSCFPVYDDDLDNLIGVLFVNDLFRAGWQVQSGRFERRAPDRPAGQSAEEPPPWPDLIRWTSPADSASRFWCRSRDWCWRCWPRCDANAGRSRWWWTSTVGWKGC
jgi:hypothetical protein